jgi:RNA polymerase sigma-70 factor (ECF subfamily)
MDTTPVSLLQRLRQPADATAWARFVDLYMPLLFHWARSKGIQDADAADLIQDVFQTMLRKLPDFVYDRARSFRGWLHTVLMNQWRTSLRRRIDVGLPDGDGRDVAVTEENSLIEREYREQLIGRALQVMRTDFKPATWQACWEHVAQGRPAVEVAKELGLTVKAVYLAKSRVLRRLRQELDGLWD